MNEYVKFVYRLVASGQFDFRAHRAFTFTKSPEAADYGWLSTYDLFLAKYYVKK